MTGRDLIIYILENHLEDEELFKDGKIPGLLTYEEAAVKFGVGIDTIKAWIVLGCLDAITIYGFHYIPETSNLHPSMEDLLAKHQRR